MPLNIIIGGVIPAVAVGIAITLIKSAGNAGLTPGLTILCASFGVATAGLIGLFFDSKPATLFVAGVPLAIAVGFFWGTATLLMSTAVQKMGLPMSISASITGANVIVTALLSLYLFNESQSLNPVRLLVGVVIMVVGSIVVTSA